MLSTIQQEKQFKSVTPENRPFAQVSQSVTRSKHANNRTAVEASPFLYLCNLDGLVVE